MIKINENQLTKLYYTIGEVAEMFNVNTSLIRFWEKEFSIIKPKKNKKGNRLFTPKEILKINMIYQLVKVKGFTLDGARQSIRFKNEEDLDHKTFSADNTFIINKLESIKDRLKEIKSRIN